MCIRDRLGGAVQPLRRIEVHRAEPGVLHADIQVLPPDVHGHPELLVRPFGGFFVGLQGVFQQVHQPVSYTHLDVYKRQMKYWVNFFA